MTRSARFRCTSPVRLGLSALLIAAAATSLSAHVVRGLDFPTLATAFVSSPTGAADAPVVVRWGAVDPGLRIVCFNVANTSPLRADRPDWPRVTGAGFELPGARTGFALVEPLGGDWQLIEGPRVSLRGTVVSLDFAIVAAVALRHGPDLRGIGPGQPAVRGSGTRFCVSGPFPDEVTPGQPTTIEQILNGVVIGFQGVEGGLGGNDFGVWDNPARAVPLFVP
jgi:hypothetical protein